MVQLPSDAPAPRLCLVQKAEPSSEYGYNLHAEKQKGQFVGVVDRGSPADKGGLRSGDRIFAVNGHSIVGENHKKVVERIKQHSTKCEMLVIDDAGAKWYAERNIPITMDLPNIIRVSQSTPASRRESQAAQLNGGSPPPAAGWYAPAAQKAVDPVFVAPPPPHQEMEKLPFICRLNKTVSADEYGFNLHAEKNRGHFIGAVDHGGIGDEAGLKMGQRIVGVNDVLIHPNTPYKEVVSIIKKSPMSTTLLVAPEDVDKWYKANNQSYSWDHAIEGKTVNGNHIEQEIIHEEDKQFSPHSIQISDEEIHVESPIPPKYDVPPPIEDDHLASHMVSAQYDLPPMDNTTPAIDSSNILDAVFGGLPASETLALAPQLEEYNHHVEVPEPVEQKELIQHPGHEHHEEETPIVDDRHANYNPYNAYQDVSQASPVSNGSSSQSSQGSLSPGRGGEDYGIYGLSAKQARERLRQQKPRAATMSLEEKYRLVSNM